MGGTIMTRNYGRGGGNRSQGLSILVSVYHEGKYEEAAEQLCDENVHRERE